MSETTVKTPSGEITVKHPADATDEQILAYARREHFRREAVASEQAVIDDKFRKGSNPASKGLVGILEGIGQGMSNIGVGAKQLFADNFSGVVTPEMMRDRLGVGQQDVADKAAIDAPLMSTPTGYSGAMVGNIAPAVPLSFVPGGNTLAGSAAVGALTGALQPAEGSQGRAVNTVIGGAFGLGGQYLGNAVSNRVGSALTNRAASRQANAVAREPISDLVNEGIESGFVVPPATGNPNLLNRSIEGLAGKTRVGQSASVINQRTANNLAKEAIGIPEDAPLSRTVVDRIRRDAGKSYERVARIGKIEADDTYREALDTLKGVRSSVQSDFPGLKVAGAKEVDEIIKGLDEQEFSSASAVELVKQFRRDAKTLFRAADDPAKLALARAHRGAADALDDLIARNLERRGLSSLAQEYNQARQTIAKSYAVDAALNEAGNIEAKVLARQLNKGAPLSDGLELTGRMADAFPQAMRSTTESFQTFSPLDFFAFGGGAGVAGVGSGGAGTAIAAIPFLRMGATRGLLSSTGQKSLLNPSPFAGKISDSGLTLLDVIGKRGGLGGAAASVNLLQQESL